MIEPRTARSQRKHFQYGYICGFQQSCEYVEMYAGELNVSRSTEYVEHLDLQSRSIIIEVDGG